MAAMKLLKQIILAVPLVTPARGGIVWTPSDAAYDRRLAGKITTATSHTNKSDAGCIVGGYNTDEPTHIYVGGPCSELGDNGPTDKFRYVEMYTFHADLQKSTGERADLDVEDGVVNTQEKDTHFEVGVGGNFKFESATITGARFFASTTSYLAKNGFEFNSNTFVTEKDGDTYKTVDDVCVEKCCDAKCTCDNGCPTTKTKVKAGDYKYSILAASYNTDNATAGKTGNGWERVVEDHGEGDGDAKALKGTFNVYQAIDFTNMKGTKLTITPQDDSNSTDYSDMKECAKDKLNDCTYYSVKAVAIEDDLDYTAQYDFPQTYNYGDWTVENGKIKATVKGTNTVKISMIKPDAAWLTALNRAGKQVAFVEYKFDVTGVTATSTNGKWMAYDPTVERKATAASTTPRVVSSAGRASGSIVMIQVALAVASWLAVQS